jgi:hypothetical protein
MNARRGYGHASAHSIPTSRDDELIYLLLHFDGIISSRRYANLTLSTADILTLRLMPHTQPMPHTASTPMPRTQPIPSMPSYKLKLWLRMHWLIERFCYSTQLTNAFYRSPRSHQNFMQYQHKTAMHA